MWPHRLHSVRDEASLLARDRLANLKINNSEEVYAMSSFDDFLKRTDDEIKAQREDKRLKDKEEHERTATLQKITTEEWPKLLPLILAETSEKGLDGTKFVPLITDRGVALGQISLLLMMSYRKDFSPYYASYKTFENAEMRELASINLVPVFDGTELKWNADALNPNSFSTTQLAEALAEKLVNVYKANLR
jgi:hypothetical protein